MATKKLTYGEQLKHPLWQKMRLQVLEAAGWQCQACQSDDAMLHVHHKQYIKGRMAWDYAIDNFESLCEKCHKETHDTKSLLNDVLANIPTAMWPSAAALLAGWADDYMPDNLLLVAWDDMQAKYAGQWAWAVSNLNADQTLETLDCFSQLNPQGFLEVMRVAVRKDFDGA